MSDLIERAARRAKPSLWRGFDDNPDSSWTEEHRHQELVFTERVVREVLAALREPSTAMLDAITARNPWIGHPEARPESVARFHRGVRQAAAADMAIMLQAFAREHGLEEPPP